MKRRACSQWLLAGLAAPVLTACALPKTTTPADGPRTVWSGRLALRIESDPPRGYSAAFELRGDPRSGSLRLFSPLGAVLAELSWTPGEATLTADGEKRSAPTIQELTRQVTGAELPLDGVFAWLGGGQAAFEGWRVLQDDRAGGRLQARREPPSPAVELRLILD